MKLSHKIAVAVLSAVASASVVVALCSVWYLWHFASRVRDPSRGLVHSVVLGSYDEGGQGEFIVYPTSKEAALAFPELYFLICGIATVLLMSKLWWHSRAREP